MAIGRAVAHDQGRWCACTGRRWEPAISPAAQGDAGLVFCDRQVYLLDRVKLRDSWLDPADAGPILGSTRSSRGTLVCCGSVMRDAGRRRVAGVRGWWSATR